MNPKILDSDFQNYLQSIEKENVNSISLKKSPFASISSAEIAQQVKGKQVAEKKFPTLYSHQKIYYPPSINLEQASSEITANYKAKLVNGKTLIDLTAGFGIDSIAFSKSFDNVIHVEKNEELSQIVESNINNLDLNISCFTGSFEEYFNQNPTEKFDCIYLDPARRNSSGRKYILEDLEPNILKYLSFFWERTDQVLVKLSPLLDISATIFQVEHVKEIHLVAVKNEMKDFLILLDKNHQNHNPKIVCANLKTNQPELIFNYEDEIHSNVRFSKPKKFIYEPNAAILKSGAFKFITTQFPVEKLHQNTHLYTSYALLDDFPGKIYEIEKIIENPKKEINQLKANVLVKNYNQNIDVLKKKYKIKDGGDKTLIFCQTMDEFNVYLTHRVKQNQTK